MSAALVVKVSTGLWAPLGSPGALFDVPARSLCFALDRYAIGAPPGASVHRAQLKLNIVRIAEEENVHLQPKRWSEILDLAVWHLRGIEDLFRSL